MNFARFGDAQDYLKKRKDYKFGIKFSKQNKTNTKEILYKKSALIQLNDSLMYFKDWHKPEEIVLYCNLVVAGRDNDDSELLREVAILEDKYNINIHVLKSPKICISSSDIRDYINNKFSIKYMVPDSVERYIKNKNLYVK